MPEMQNELNRVIDSLSSLYALDVLQPYYFNYWKQNAGLPDDLNDAPASVRDVSGLEYHKTTLN
jgi:hypothetical protein